ncbi:MAG: hypothetical protein L6R40_008764 [Gallowayella cf. fulva]|nr:MAG: hypothetical protein L6R40_008764 [Xanthomendoza cf. fulva]
MAPQKRKQKAQGRSSNNVAVQDTSENFYGNSHVPQEQVADPSFSIDMFQPLSVHPYDDPNQPPILTTVVRIRPDALWASLPKYQNFVSMSTSLYIPSSPELMRLSKVREESYAVHQYALITRFQSLPKCHCLRGTDDAVPCVARILEIRALDRRTVYIRIYWFNSPEQMPRGRQPHHGKDELIATNHMEIIHAVRSLRRVDVVEWTEQEKEPPRYPPGGYYWRQTYHVLTEELSVSGRKDLLRL